jgi:DNA-binding response OmpR family regulator
MTDVHRVLIVEDDPVTAEDIAEITRSLDCDPTLTDNSADAVTLMRNQSFCIVLLDLAIKKNAKSLKGHSAHGNALLREIRTRHGANRGTSFWIPILIISGHANDVDSAVEMMKEGADDVIRKPVRPEEVTTRIQNALDKSGRNSHGDCTKRIAQITQNSDAILIAIIGDVEKRRTLTSVSGRTVWLTDGSLRVLLRLAVAHEEGKSVHKTELGARLDRGFREISRLREELRQAPEIGERIITNDYHGDYSISPDVVFTHCNAQKVSGVGDAAITSLAKALDGHISHRTR